MVQATSLSQGLLLVGESRMDSRQEHIAVAKSEDLVNLLNHIAWTDVISPKLTELKSQYTKVLTAAVLGTPIVINGVPITKEQIAGRIEGIDFIYGLFAKILKEGARAIEKYKNININLSTE